MTPEERAAKAAPKMLEALKEVKTWLDKQPAKISVEVHRHGNTETETLNDIVNNALIEATEETK